MLLLALVVAIAIPIAIVASNPLRRNDKKVKEWLLGKVSIGSTIENFNKVALAEEWRVQDTTSKESETCPKIQAASYKFAVLGRYWDGLFSPTVYSCWAFDSEGKLLDVSVGRWIK
jgi:hypothetical protein